MTKRTSLLTPSFTRRGFGLGVAALGVTPLLGGTAFADSLRIDIQGGNHQPTPIAIPDFVGQGEAQTIGSQLTAVLSADLERSGLFAPIDKGAFLQPLPTITTQPRFPDWRTINAALLVQGVADIQADGQVHIAYRLWDVFAAQEMTNGQFSTTTNNWRRLAHKIADEIYKKLTGEDGYFDSRVVYVSEVGPATKKIKRLAIMDQDGANHRYLTDGSTIVLTPRFSPLKQEITYMSFIKNQARVLLRDVDGGQEEALGNFPGLTFAPRFSPDGNKVAMSMAVDGNTDIYEMDLRTRHARRLTNHPAIDTSPSYSPDGQQIVFNSDRSGGQQLYVMTADGANQKRISFGDGRYATPVWSPRGDLIAFTKLKGGDFYIGVMHPDGTGERMLSSGFDVESPTWAPNGRVLMFFRSDRNGADPGLYTIDLTGYNERRLITPAGASDPAWSPLLP